ncbi:unnamed protein product [Phytophthora lilii]|uniref:Unnamed protein product n=1 Tax=Phytophthora lilii TaxID=2077276 RepID=A0A9W6WS60_9STRA|nr:unnamed protein product [Phytophthora lilii]
MRPSPLPRALLAAALLAATSALDFGFENDVTQTAGTVAPGPATESETPPSGVNGFGKFGAPAVPSSSSDGAGGQGWPHQAGAGGQGWPQQAGTGGQGWPHQAGTGRQGWPSQPGTWWTPPSGGWWSQKDNGGGRQEWGTLGVDCSDSNDGGWTPPTGGQGSGTLGVDCSALTRVAGVHLAVTKDPGRYGV